MTVLTACLLVLFLLLGRWQWDRAEYKQSLLEGYLAGEVTSLLGARSPAELDRYARIEVEGRWHLDRQFLLDNRTRGGRAGFEVLTPFQLQDGRWLVVNRGWLLFDGFRERLPDVEAGFPGDALTQTVRITGRIDDLPTPGLASGRAAPTLTGAWPRVTSFPETRELALALGLEANESLEPGQLLLDADSGFGYERNWRAFPPGKGPEQNWSYAIQWWSFAVVLLILYVGLNLRRNQRENPEHQRD